MIRSLSSAALIAALTLPAQAQEATPTELAQCAGVWDAMFAFDHAAADAEYLDKYAEQAHIFYVLARHAAKGGQSAALHIARQQARADLEAETNDDEIHGTIQACSDLHQHLIREGRFIETPG